MTQGTKRVGLKVNVATSLLAARSKERMKRTEFLSGTTTIGSNQGPSCWKASHFMVNQVCTHNRLNMRRPLSDFVRIVFLILSGFLFLIFYTFNVVVKDSAVPMHVSFHAFALHFAELL